MTTGKDLLDLGFKSGKWFKEALEHINAHALEGEALLAYLREVGPPPALPLLPEPAPFYENIRAKTPVEQQNIDYVRLSMQQLMRTPTVVTGAVMPDACPAGPVGTIPVGGVVVARQAIHPGMHSADICCSVMLTNLGKIDPKTVLDVAQQVTHFGPGGRGPERQYALPAALRAEFAANPFLDSQITDFGLARIVDEVRPYGCIMSRRLGSKRALAREKAAGEGDPRARQIG